jgi:23S rRNA (adenine2503-C2)-methyltransferase
MAPAPPADTRPALSGLPLHELTELLKPLPAFRARQIVKWIAGGAQSFAQMSNLPLNLREELDRRFLVYSSQVSARLEDPDGTVKLQIRLRDGLHIEAVLLAEAERDSGGGAGAGDGGPAAVRYTACLSTQAGCPAGCVFCRTGALGFRRNLDSSEIVEQFFLLRALVPAVSNIVVMGMGEPLLNLGELRRALAVLTSPAGPGLSPRRITVSTSGIAAGIRDLAEGGPAVRLALSLTTAREELRQALMPIGRANPLPALKDALVFFQQKGGGRITLEAVLLSGLNTGPEDAAALIAFARGLDVVVNLIPWNPAAGLEFAGQALREPPRGEVERFARLLKQGGLGVTRRFRRGRSVRGACGQLGVLERPEKPGKEDLGQAD